MIPDIPFHICPKSGDLIKNNVTGDVCLLLKVEKTWIGDDVGTFAMREIRYTTFGPDGDIINSSAGFWDKVSA